MVGTGAAAVADAVALTRHAAELGFAGALLLPPFYYKGVPDDGLVAYVDTIVQATRRQADPDLPLSFPAAVRPALARPAGAPPARHVRRPHRRLEGFLRRHGLCARGRGDLERALRCSRRPKRCCWKPAPAPSPAASRPPPISTPISASAPGARATGRRSTHAVTIRKLFDGKALVSGVKALLAHIHADPALARVKPPLAPFPAGRPRQRGRRLRSGARQARGVSDGGVDADGAEGHFHRDRRRRHRRPDRRHQPAAGRLRRPRLRAGALARPRSAPASTSGRTPRGS